jgi:hypothetical protein
VSTDLEARYGAAPTWQRPVTLAAASLIAVVALGWLGWTMWFHGNPDVTSELVGYDVVDATTTTAVVDVTLSDGVEATCRLRALAEDKSAVGDLAFTPEDGRNEVVIRTERLATSVEKLGCTSADQARPR